MAPTAKPGDENPFKDPTHIPNMTPAITTKIVPYLAFNMNNSHQPTDSFREKIVFSYENDQSKPKDQESLDDRLPVDILEIGKREEIWQCENRM